MDETKKCYNKKEIKKYMRYQMLKDWNKLEKLLLFGSIALVSLVAVVFKTDMLSTFCSILCIITALLVAKGKNLGQVLGVIITVVYSIVSFRNGFYGEIIIYVFMMLPMYIIGIVSWMRHQNKKTNTVEVNTIGKKEWLLVSLISIGAFIGIYFLLKSFDTNELVVSTVSVVASLFAIYLQIRRSRFSFYFYIINDLILIVLWGIPVIAGNLLVLPMVFNPAINLINDSYGVYNWKRLEKRQTKGKSN